MFCPSKHLLDTVIHSPYQKFHMSMFESAYAKSKTHRAIIRSNQRALTLEPGHAKNNSINLSTDVPESHKSRIFLWGQACYGALGAPDAVYTPFIKEPGQNDIPTRCSSVENFKVRDLACGYGFTIFAVNEKRGQLMGTGVNKDGQIPYYSSSDNEPFEVLVSPSFIQLPNDEDVVRVSAGRSHCVALTESGNVFAMGNNSYGQCGSPVFTDKDFLKAKIIRKMKFTRKPDSDKIIDVTCGLDHSVFLSESGKLYSSGLGSDGQTGLGHYSCQFTPSQVEGDVKNEKMIKVACSADCVLSLNDKGEVFGWGNSEYGQFRSVTDEQQIHTPVSLKLKGVGKVIDVAAGGTICMVLNENRDVFVWGFGILGEGSKLTQTAKPVLLPRSLFCQNDKDQDTFVTSIACGLSSNSAINSKGDLYTWGKSRKSCLGVQNQHDQLIPAKVHLGAEVFKVSLGVEHIGALCKSTVKNI